jgi:hypothetical protein
MCHVTYYNHHRCGCSLIEHVDHCGYIPDNHQEGLTPQRPIDPLNCPKRSVTTFIGDNTCGQQLCLDYDELRMRKYTAASRRTEWDYKDWCQKQFKEAVQTTGRVPVEGNLLRLSAIRK